PMLGRLSAMSNDESDDGVVVMSYGLWQRVFGGDPAVVGRALSMNGRPRSIVAVMPPDFHFPDGTAQYWIPSHFSPEFRHNRDQYMFVAVGRLRDGVTVDRARADMEIIAARLRRDWSQYNT